jgi:hypothetical protein
MAAPVDQLRMDNLKAKFTELFVTPLTSGADALEPKIVELHQDEATAQASAAQVAAMVTNVASTLKGYKRNREAFKTIALDTGNASNIGPDAKPFPADANGDALFNELVTCCYADGTVKDCATATPSGFYAVFERKNPEPACIEAIITRIMGTFPVPTDAQCDEYAALLAKQNDAAQQVGGRRTRRRGRKGKSRKGSRRH